MVCGVVPFKASNMQDLYWAILRAEFTFPIPLTPECKDLIWRMLWRMPEDRISIPEIMNHPWFAKDSSFELNSTISWKECTSMLNGNGIISDSSDT